MNVRRLLVPLALCEICWLGLWMRLDVFVHFWAYQGLFALAFAAYVWALILALPTADASNAGETPGPGTQALLVLLPALLFRLTLLPAEIAFSDDIFRYIWNGRVSAAGIDPYAYAPGDEALASLRDQVIWPNVNAKDQPSPYPPLLESWFALIYRVWPESLTAMKLAMIMLDIGVIGLLLLLLHMRGLAPLRAAIYAWSPQVVFQVAFSGHNEPLLLFWIMLALVLGQRPIAARRTQNAERRKGSLDDATHMAHSGSGFLHNAEHSGWWRISLQSRRLFAAFALAMATLAKLVPVLVLPILLQRWGWRAASVYCMTVGVVYGALLLRGQRLFGGIAIETTVAQFNDGLYYPIHTLAEVIYPADPHALAQLVARTLLLGIIGWLMLRTGDDMAMPLGVVLAAYVLLAASVAPWYVLWVLPFVCLDALPSPLGKRSYHERLFGGYWLPFSWTVAFSELYYLGSRLIWVGAHILEYALPCMNLALNWARTTFRPGRP